MKRILLASIFTLFTLLSFGASVTFLTVYKGASYTSSTMTITTPILGSNFKITSADPTATSFTAYSGNNVAGVLSYISNSGNLVQINGAIQRQTKSGNTTDAYFFFETTYLESSTITGNCWLLVIPGRSIADNSSPGSSGDFKASDFDALRSSQASNSAPVISSNGGLQTATITISENTTAVTTVTATDADAGDSKSFSISGGVDFAKFSIVANTGVLTFTSAPDYENPTDNGRNNTYDVQVTVTDSKGSTDTQTITVYVTNTNDNSPVITSNGAGSSATVHVTAGTTLITNNDATDADGNNLTFSISGTNANMATIDSNTGVLSFNSNAVAGTYTIIITVSDGSTTDTQTLTVIVDTSDITPPTLVITAADTHLSSGESTTVYFQFSEQVQGFTSSDITLVGGTIGTITQSAQDPALYYATFTQTGSSTSPVPSITVASTTYQDLANNNNAASSSISFSIDLTAPTVTVSIEGTDIAYGTTRLVTITFSEDPGLSFKSSDIQVSNGTITNLIQDSSDPKIWTCTLQSTNASAGPTVTVPNGSYTDLAGNSGNVSNGSNTDSSTLAPPAVDLANTSASDTGESNSDNITSNKKPVIIGLLPSNDATATITVTQGSTSTVYTYAGLTVTLQNSLYQCSVDLSTATVTSGTAFPSGGLSDGTIVIRVTGTTSTATTTNSFVVDTTNPNIPSVTPNTISDAAPTLTGSATLAEGEKLTVTINGITYTNGDGNLSFSSGTWTLNIPSSNSLSLGVYSVTATVTDKAGNFSNDATTGELTIQAKVSVADGVWGTGSNWNESTTPTSSTTVQIQHNISIPSGTTLTSGTILLKSNSTDGRGKLTNNGNLTIDGDLIFEVDENAISSQFLNLGSITINGKIIVRKKFTKNKWYLMSFPFEVSDTKIYRAGTTTQVGWGDYNSATDYDMYIGQYDGSKRATSGTVQTNSSNWSNVSPKTLVARHGYFIALDTNCPFGEVDFTAAAANSDPLNNIYSASEVSKNTSARGSLHSDWNLVGLPYVSAFDLINAQNFKPHYIYASNNFTDVMGTDNYNIYPFSAFYLQATGSSNALDFASAGRKINLPAANTNTIDEIQMFLTKNGMTDRTRIRFEEEGMADFQNGKDAVKFFSPESTYPQIYSVTEGVSYSTNDLPVGTEMIQLNIRTGISGDYQLSLTNSLYERLDVTLVDQLANSQTSIKDETTIDFNVSTLGTSDRFYLLVREKTPNEIITLESTITLAQEQNSLKISGLSKNSLVKLMDISGKTIYYHQGSDESLNIQLGMSGIYILTIDSDSKHIVKKIAKS